MSRLIIKIIIIIIIIKDDFLYLSRRRRLEELDSGGGRICGRTDGASRDCTPAEEGKALNRGNARRGEAGGEMNDEALHYAMIGGRPKGEATSDRVAAATAAGSGSSSVA